MFHFSSIIIFKHAVIVLCYIVRHILASLHFHENVNRQRKICDDGEEYFRVTYPKFKLGNEVVCRVTVPPTYGMFPVLNAQGVLCDK